MEPRVERRPNATPAAPSHSSGSPPTADATSGSSGSASWVNTRHGGRCGVAFDRQAGALQLFDERRRGTIASSSSVNSDTATRAPRQPQQIVKARRAPPTAGPRRPAIRAARAATAGRRCCGARDRASRCRPGRRGGLRPRRYRRGRRVQERHTLRAGSGGKRLALNPAAQRPGKLGKRQRSSSCSRCASSASSSAAQDGGARAQMPSVPLVCRRRQALVRGDEGLQRGDLRGCERASASPAAPSQRSAAAARAGAARVHGERGVRGRRSELCACLCGKAGSRSQPADVLHVAQQRVRGGDFGRGECRSRRAQTTSENSRSSSMSAPRVASRTHE